MINLKFETITPLHISNGNQLAYNLDYIIKDGYISKFNRIMVSKVLAEANLFDFSKNYSAFEFIKIIEKNKNLLNDDVFEYKAFIEDSFDKFLDNENRVGMKYIQEFININGKFYIPGSSIKGMLTTILNRNPVDNPLGINPKNASIKDKFVITDSEYISDIFFGVETVQRPPAINILTLNKDAEFSSKIKNIGNLNIEKLRDCLSKYSFLQLNKAKDIVLKFKTLEKKPGGATNYYSILEKIIDQIKLKDEEYLVNLGFGGGSYFKIFNSAEIPKFKSKAKSKKRVFEEAHTTFFANIDNEQHQLGWCKLIIE